MVFRAVSGVAKVTVTPAIRHPNLSLDIHLTWVGDGHPLVVPHHCVIQLNRRSGEASLRSAQLAILSQPNVT